MLRLALILAATGSACGGDDLTLPNEGEPAEVEILRGDRQNGTVGEALGDSLVVKVTDRFGSPVAGALVGWKAEGGGTVDPAESLTDRNGQAGTTRVLGPQPTTYFTVATIEGLPDPVTFMSTGLAARLVITSELPAIAVSGVPLSPQPTLQLQDVDGTPIARDGVIVTVQIASGGGSLTGATSAISDPEGRVAFADLAISGSPGTRRLIFAADAFAPATTPPIALGVGAPASIELAAGDDQTATVGEAVPIDPAVLVRDADGNPLDGIPVTFTIGDGGGTLSDRTPVTGPDGVATVSGWKLGTTAGENTLSAAVSGQSLSGSPVVFSATGTPGGVSAEQSTVTAAPANIAASTGSSASTITVTVRDAFDNPLAGVEVTLAVVGGSENSLVQPTDPTNADGVTTGRLSSTVVGDRTISATAGGLAIIQTAAVAVTAGVPSAAASSATVPNGEAGEVTTIEILLKDASGNPVLGGAGAIAISIAGANNVTGVTAADQGAGRYTATYTPEIVGTDRVTIRVSGGALARSPFLSQVVPGPANPATSTAELSVTFFGVGAIVTARDAHGNPVGHGGETVVMTVAGAPPVTATDLDDGTYQAAVFLLGVRTVEIEMNGVPIQGSPFRVN